MPNSSSTRINPNDVSKASTGLITGQTIKPDDLRVKNFDHFQERDRKRGHSTVSQRNINS